MDTIKPKKLYEQAIEFMLGDVDSPVIACYSVKRTPYSELLIPKGN